MKKIILGISLVATSSIPLSIVVSCGSNSVDDENSMNNQKYSAKIVENAMKVKANFVNQGTRKASEIAKSIKDKEDLNDEFNIRIPNIKNADITINVSATKEGLATIKVDFKSKNLSESYTETVQGLSDKEIEKKIINQLQEKNNNLVKKVLDESGHIIEQGNQKVSEISKDINTVDKLAEKLGIYIPELNGSIVKVSTSSEKNGLINVSVEVITMGADVPSKTFIKVIKGKSDEKIDSFLEETEKNKEEIQKNNERYVKNSLDRIRIVNGIFSNSSNKIIESIENSQDLLDKLNVDLLNIPNSNISYDLSSDDKGLITLSVKLQAKSSGIPAKTFIKKIQGKTDEEIEIDKKELNPKGTITEQTILRNRKISDYYNFNNIPINFSEVTSIAPNGLKKLVELPKNVNFSKLKSIGEGGLENLRTFPEGVDLSKLEVINKNGLKNLIEFPNNVTLPMLKTLNEKSLENLVMFPNGVTLHNLTYIGPYALSKLFIFPESVDLSNLNKIDSHGLSSLRFFPNNVNLSSLKEILAYGLLNLISFPKSVDLHNLEKIGFMALNNLTSLPNDVNLSHLSNIDDYGLQKLLSLPENIDLSNLKVIGSYSLSSLNKFPDEVDLSSLTSVSSNGLSSLVELPENIDLTNLINISQDAFSILLVFPIKWKYNSDAWRYYFKWVEDLKNQRRKLNI
ncbi:MAG: hypothetical protein HRT99_01210 [Mycoplasmatales bacterium]|nr:hypothetical protein [Mycoplasmatales bacterium]